MDYYHNYPVNDLEKHFGGYDCPCNPTIEFMTTNGLDYIMITHNAFDFREVKEELNLFKKTTLPTFYENGNN